MIIDNELGDIKKCSSLSSVDSQLREAIHQNCSDVVLDVTADLSEKSIRDTVRNRLERTENKIKRIFVFLDNRLLKL